MRRSLNGLLLGAALAAAAVTVSARSGRVFRHLFSLLRSASLFTSSGYFPFAPNAFSIVGREAIESKALSGRDLACAGRLLVAGVLFGVAAVGSAQTQSETRFEYDGAGNIVRVVTETNDAPPTVSALIPAFAHQGETVFVTAAGNNLVRASVSTSRPDVIVQDVTATKFSVRFRVIALVSAAIGPADLTFTTRLGSTNAVFTVAGRTPVITTSPNPIVLAPDGVNVPVRLIFEQAFDTDQTFDISMQDTAVASVSSASVVLPAGETVATVNAAGLGVGATNLEVNQLSNSLALAIPVVVIDAQLPNATNQFYAQAVGVSVFTGPPPYTGTGVFHTPGPVGAAYGLAVTQTIPFNVSAGASATLVVEGVELDRVTAIGFDSTDGITITGPHVVNPAGTEMQIPIAVAATAARDQRVIIFTTAGGASVFSGGVIRITN